MELKWVERKFNFGYGPEYLPLFLERLHSTSPVIIELTRNLTEGKASIMPSGKWSVKQHIGHLTDLEELHEGRLHDFRNGINPLRAADMGNKKTKEADHNSNPLSALISAFTESRQKFIEHVTLFSEEELQRRSLHPRLKQEINVIDLLHFIAEHDLFHQTIMRDIIRQF
jgi:uncharacterized damage-inducible protein DinB